MKRKILLAALTVAAAAALAAGLSACGDNNSNSTSDDGHVHDLQPVYSRPATCTEDGNINYFTCNDCGKWYANSSGTTEITDHDSVVIAAKGHDYTDGWSVTSKQHWSECTVCHEKKDEGEHNFVNGICSVCEMEQYTEGLIFFDNEDDSYSVFCGSVTDTDVIIPSVYNGKPVTQISSNAFSGNAQTITSIKIPESITYIGHSAFGYCTALKSITLPNKITCIEDCLFEGCKELESIVIPEGVTEIGISAFYKCAGLKSISIPNTVKTIKSTAFKECTALESLVIPDSVTDLSSDFTLCSNLKTLVIGKGVTSLNSSILTGCSKLESLTLPFVGQSVKTETDTGQYPLGWIFSQYSFDGCERTRQTFYNTSTTVTEYEDYYIPVSLKSVTVTGGNILFGAFSNCKNITEVVLPENITKIGAAAFGSCGLTDIKLPESVTEIGDGAFSNCDFTHITIPEHISVLGNNVFNACYSLKTVSIADGITAITDSLFNYCTELTEVTIPDSVTSIEDYAFNTCSKLKRITIGSGVNKIGKNAFQACIALEAVNIKNIEAWCKIEFGNIIYNTYAANPLNYAGNLYVNGKLLTKLTIPESITELGDWTFYGCKSLTSVTFHENFESLGTDTFAGCIRLVEIYNLSSLQINKENYQQCGYVSLHALDIYTSKNSASKLHYTDDGYIFYEVGALVYLITYTGNETKLTLPLTYNDKYYSIYDYAFYNYNSLNSITIPYGIKGIGYSAFYGCKNLTSITIPDSVTELGIWAFRQCSSLNTAVIGNGIAYIESGTFGDCLALTNVDLGNNITAIGDGAFANCSSLTSIIIPSSITYLTYGIFSDSMPEQMLFAGTASEWNDISGSEKFSSIVYFYCEDEPEDDGNYWHYGEDNKPELW